MRSRVASGKTAPGVQAGSGMAPRRTQRPVLVGAGSVGGAAGGSAVAVREGAGAGPLRARVAGPRIAVNQTTAAIAARMKTAKNVFFIVAPPWKGRTAHDNVVRRGCQPLTDGVRYGGMGN